MSGRTLAELPAAGALAPADGIYIEQAAGSRRATVQALRDYIAERRAYGSLFMQGNATATTITTQNVAVKIAGATTAGVANRITATDNRLTRCSCPNPRVYRIIATVQPSGGANTVFEVMLYIGGVAVPFIVEASRFRVTVPPAARPVSVTTQALVELPPDAWVEVWIANTSGTGNVTVEDLQLTIAEVG